MVWNSFASNIIFLEFCRRNCRCKTPHLSKQSTLLKFCLSFRTMRQKSPDVMETHFWGYWWCPRYHCLVLSHTTNRWALCLLYHEEPKAPNRTIVIFCKSREMESKFRKRSSNRVKYARLHLWSWSTEALLWRPAESYWIWVGFVSPRTQTPLKISTTATSSI